MEQRSLEWFRARLGQVTGSEVGKLMVRGRAKNETFGETAKSYLYRLSAERRMNPAIVSDDDLMQQYVDFNELRSRAIRWGREQEENAKELLRARGLCLTETGSVAHPTLPHFAASPDALLRDAGTGAVTGVVEIKSPSQEVFARYAAEVVDGASLRRVNALYYWQTVAEMMCVGVERCLFVVFCPWQWDPLHVVPIELDKADADALAERVMEAEAFIECL